MGMHESQGFHQCGTEIHTLAQDQRPCNVGYNVCNVYFLGKYQSRERQI